MGKPIINVCRPKEFRPGLQCLVIGGHFPFSRRDVGKIVTLVRFIPAHAESYHYGLKMRYGAYAAWIVEGENLSMIDLDRSVRHNIVTILHSASIIPQIFLMPIDCQNVEIPAESNAIGI